MYCYKNLKHRVTDPKKRMSTIVPVNNLVVNFFHDKENFHLLNPNLHLLMELKEQQK